MANPPFILDSQWLKTNFADLRDFDLIGKGGQKLVFGAKHDVDGDVVLKIFQLGQARDEVDREILAVQQVQSLHVPRILAMGTVDTPIGRAYWVREQRIHGESLRTRLARGPLAANEVLRLGNEVSGALVLAEAVSIVHRDVKPDNIIVDTQGKYWLLDFGLARHLALDSLTLTGLPFGKGTLGYAPPEQVRNDKRNIDARADLFGLGVTLYEAGKGANPFRQGARDDREILQRTENMPLPLLDLPINDAGSFRDLVAAMTQKRRDHRPASAAEAARWMGEVCLANGV